MNTKKILSSFKKAPYNLSLIFLTTGASLILGFLSFSGMYSLLPILPLAFASLALSVSYEGEIYLQNIKGAFKKLFKNHIIENDLAKAYLLEHFLALSPESKDDEHYPQFFKDYKRQFKLLSAFNHKELNKASKKKKRRIERTLKDMEKWFATQLFSTQSHTIEEESNYAQQLRLWLETHGQKQWQDRLQHRNNTFTIIKSFSLVSGLFMGLGTIYLIGEAFLIIPFFAAIPLTFWPLIILPMAIVAGAAYSMLTLNAVTDLVNNNTLLKWYHKLRNDLSQGLTIRNVLMTGMAILLVILAIGLTICTAGTWWTIVNNSRPLFNWMKKIPHFVMGIINPIITGLSALVFILQNTAESLEKVDEGLNWAEKNIKNQTLWQKIYQPIVSGIRHLIDTENWLQIVNPFRFILKLIITPLRIVLFLGHLVSIAVTADRMPGIPQIIPALIAIISEGFEDAHYFIGHDHGAEENCQEPGQQGKEAHHHDFKTLLKERLDPDGGHEHHVDLPTWIIKTIALPLYALAALWDSTASKLNPPCTVADNTRTHQRRVLNFEEAWNKQRGIKKGTNVVLPITAKRPSEEWQKEHVISLIEKHQSEHLEDVQCDQGLADTKIIALNKLKTRIGKPQPGDTLNVALQEAKTQAVYNRHRLFSWGENTQTQQFIENLPERVNVVNAMS